MNNDFIFPGGKGLNLMWENPAPTDSFAVQTITIPGLSRYKYILISFGRAGGQNAAVVLSTSDTTKRDITMADHIVFVERGVTIAGDSVTITSCSVYYTYGSASGAKVLDTYAIPQTIFGVV